MLQMIHDESRTSQAVNCLSTYLFRHLSLKKVIYYLTCFLPISHKPVRNEQSARQLADWKESAEIFRRKYATWKIRSRYVSGGEGEREKEEKGKTEREKTDSAYSRN